MPKRRTAQRVDASLLEAALIGYEQMKRGVEEKMSAIRSRLSTGTGAAPSAGAPSRRLSVAARRRIAAAQRKRWALAKAKQAKPKRVLSAAARKKIAAAQKKRWALLKAQKAQPAARKVEKKVAAAAAS